MKFLKPSTLLILSLTFGCSMIPKQQTTMKTSTQYRQMASVNDVLADRTKLQERVQKLMDGIFHSYLMGQIYLQDFDKTLEKRPHHIMKTMTYSKLLAVRNYVDTFEHDFNTFYLDLVIATAVPETSPEQKANAQAALDSMGKFLDGIRSNTNQLPENLRPLVLTGLREKQTIIYDELKSLHDDSNFTHNNEEVKEILHKNMVLLRATRLAYFKDMNQYHVDPKVVQEVIRQEKKKESYRKLEKNVKALSIEMKSLISDIGRDTSSDVIYPSAGPNGNITGRTFPAGTWALTYDDGPAKTSPQVLANLLEKKIPATFFMLAQQVEMYSETAKKIKEAGMNVACHSYTHAQLTKVGPAQLEKEIVTAKKVIEQKLDTQIKLFRLPYGAGVSVSRIRAKIAENKMIHVFWSVDTLDWQDKNPQSILARALKQMSAQKAGVILFHDIHPQSVAASSLLMDWFNKNKTNTCTIQGIVDQMNNNLPACK